MTGSISEPSMAVVAMVEPEMAEKTVPATTATTASRPGTWRTRRSIPSMTFSASPVWKRTSPIRTKSGIGVSEKLITAAALFLSIWLKPASPPRNKIAPTILIAMKAKATGRPMNRSSVEPPSSSSEASCQDISAPLGRRHRIVPGPPLGQREAMHAKEKLDAEQHKGHRHRREQPPFRDDQRLDRKRAALEARHRNARPVPDKVKAANHAENVADPFEQPADLGGQRAQHDIDADVLSLPQQAGSGQERQEIDDVLGYLIAGCDPAQTDVAQQHIAADQQRHRQEQEARQQHQRVEQATVPVRQSRHAGTAPHAALIRFGEELHVANCSSDNGLHCLPALNGATCALRNFPQCLTAHSARPAPAPLFPTPHAFVLLGGRRGVNEHGEIPLARLFVLAQVFHVDRRRM